MADINIKWHCSIRIEIAKLCYLGLTIRYCTKRHFGKYRSRGPIILYKTTSNLYLLLGLRYNLNFRVIVFNDC